MKKRILIISSTAPYPLDNGGAQRLYHIPRLLSDDYEFHLITFSKQGVEASMIADAAPFYASVKTVPLGRYPARLNAVRITPRMVLHHKSSEMGQVISSAIDQYSFDLVQIDYTQMGQYARLLPNSLPRVLVVHDIAHIVYKQLFLIKPISLNKLVSLSEYAKILFYERRVFHNFRQLVALSDPDGKYLHKICSNKQSISVIPQGFDEHQLKGIIGEHSDKPQLLIVANLGTQPNIIAINDYLKYIHPRLKKRFPGLTIWIVGSDPHNLFNGKRIKGVEFTGYDDDLSKFYARKPICILPYRIGSGMRTKVLEAMAAGLPIIATPLAVSGIPLLDGESALIESSIPRFVDRLGQLIPDAQARLRLGESARELAFKHFTWGNAAQLVDCLFQSILG